MSLFGFSLTNIFGKATSKHSKRRYKRSRYNKQKTRGKKTTRKYRMRGG